ncbi:MAG TPA: T9SS type A sorting domain-containing protein [Candidatus Krumholzibacteria bacterium]
MLRIPVLLALLLLLGNYPVRADVPVHSWSQRLGGTVTDSGKVVAADAQGNVIIAGEFGGTINLGGANLVASSTDVLVAKFDGSGAHQWSRKFGGSLAQHVTSIDVDASGNVVLTGYFESTIDCGGGPLSSAGSTDVFLAKLDAGGVHLWSKRFGSTATSEEGLSVAFDGSGNVFVTGRIRGSVDFGGGALPAAGYYDMFLARFDGEGNHQWSRRFGGGDVNNDKSVGQALTTDGSGSVIVSGHFYGGDLDLGGGPLAGEQRYDMFLAKFDAGGLHQWSQRFGISGWWKEAGAIVVEQSGDIILMGEVDGSVLFPYGFLNTNGGSQDILLAGFGADGTPQWGRVIGSSGVDGCESMTLDPQGNLLITGPLTFPVNFGGGELTSSDGSDVYLASFDADGHHRWSERFAGTGNQSGLGVACGPSGAIFVTGELSGYADFGGGYLFSAGASDILLAKFTAILTATDEMPAARVLSISSFPNPFNPRTTIRYTVPSHGRVTVAIYDARGAQVATVVDRIHPPGAYGADWNGRGDRGEAVSSGIYFATVVHSGLRLSSKMVLLK